MNHIIIEQENIDFYEVEAIEFFNLILTTDYQSVMATDWSSLSDFIGKGFVEGSEEAGQFDEIIKSKSYEQICDFWDSFILNKIKEVYGIELKSTNTTLTDIFLQISQAKKVVYNH